MLIFNKNYEIVAVSMKILTILDIKDINEFLKIYNKISDIFIYEDEKDHDKKDILLEDIINCAEHNFTDIFLKMPNNEFIKLNIDIYPIFFKNDVSNFYQIIITKIFNKFSELCNNSLLEKDIQFKNPTLYEISKTSYLKAKEEINPRFFLPLLSKFIKAANNSYEELCESKLLGDEENVKKITKNLASLAIELNFDEFINILVRIELSENDKMINLKFSEYEIFINRLNELAKKEFK